MNVLEKILKEIEHEAMTNKDIGRKQCEGMARAMNIIRSHMCEDVCSNDDVVAWKPKCNIAVHCKTEAEAKDFCRKMHENGMRWSGGDSYLDYTWYDVYGEETCYTGYRMFADYEYYKEKGYKILEWEDYMDKELNFELLWERQEPKKMTVEEMRQKLEELTGEVIGIKK